MAVAMTNARLGSKSPSTSMKPMTFAGLIIWETVSPRPKSSPDASAAKKEAMRSESDQMTKDEAGNDGCRHERSGGHEGAPREPGNTADAMTAGAAATETCAEADQESADHDERPRDRNREVRQFAPRHPVQHGRGDQSDSERNPPCDIARPSRPKTAAYAADPVDPAIGEPQHGSGKPDQHAANGCGNGCEVLHQRFLGRALP